MEIDDLLRIAQEISDKQALHELNMRYCRAVDRRDRDLFLSCYHPDAVDDHGLFCGGPAAFADWLGMTEDGGRKTTPFAMQHVITNEFFVLDGDVAWGESYQSRRHGPNQGNYIRYIDRYERGDDGWRIKRRKLVFDWTPPDGRFAECARRYEGKDDPFYEVLNKTF
jgi:hypothetical protein